MGHIVNFPIFYTTQIKNLITNFLTDFFRPNAIKNFGLVQNYEIEKQKLYQSKLRNKQ
jgi:hypothetical protein